MSNMSLLPHNPDVARRPLFQRNDSGHSILRCAKAGDLQIFTTFAREAKAGDFPGFHRILRWVSEPLPKVIFGPQGVDLTAAALTPPLPRSNKHAKRPRSS